jgi:hypothetical protein
MNYSQNKTKRSSNKEKKMAKEKKVLKKPTGEFSKTTSGYADFLKERRPNISKSEAAAQAGKVRDAGYSTSDFKKASPSKKTMAPKPKPNAAEKVIQDITNRYRVTAREARDIVTAVGTLGRAVVDKNIIPGGSNNSLAGKKIDTGDSVSRKSIIEAATRNLVKQTKETGSAASKGKKGTTSAKVNTDTRDKMGNPRGGRYDAAKKRTK